MKTIPATKFKEQCLALLDSVGPDGITITKRGRAVARLVPVGGAGKALIGSFKDRIAIRGDLLSTRVAWNAEP